MDLLMILHLKKKRTIKLTKKQQFSFINLLSDLLKNGFTIQESLNFMEKSHTMPKKIIQFLTHLMKQGESFDRALAFLAFDPLVITQIELAQKHGNLSQTLEKICQYMTLVTKQRQNFYKIISYPVLLLIFVGVVLVGMRQFLLPQLITTNMVQRNNFGIQFIQNSPYYFIGAFILGLTLILAVKVLLNRREVIQKANFLTSLPLIGSFYANYYSAFFALEWGKLFSQGLEIKTVLQLMSRSNQLSLMKEVAKTIEKQSISGLPFHEQLKEFHFFSLELATIIEQGEVKGNLGRELIIYSDLSFQQFFLKIEKAIQWIQPVIFLFVAILVVSVYAAMLMPIYGGMENFL
ncbi:competence type IV pilus assembly protein ComGB [Enterococcus sp. LJL99]